MIAIVALSGLILTAQAIWLWHQIRTYGVEQSLRIWAVRLISAADAVQAAGVVYRKRRIEYGPNMDEWAPPRCSGVDAAAMVFFCVVWYAGWVVMG